MVRNHHIQVEHLRDEHQHAIVADFVYRIGEIDGADGDFPTNIFTHFLRLQTQRSCQVQSEPKWKVHDRKQMNAE
jgi:hypothetical protein